MSKENCELVGPADWMTGGKVCIDEKAFLPISITSLVVNAKTDFDLYTKPKEDALPVLYRARKLSFTKEDLLRLQESQVYDLYVSGADEVKFQKYIESNLRAILQDKERNSNEKAGLLYYCSRSVASDVFKDPCTGESINRSKALVENLARFLSQDESCLPSLMYQMSSDYYTYTHCVNVCVFSLALAQFCGIKTMVALRELGEGALLHDIGKIKVDSELLSSEKNYTEGQFEEMKLHTVYGYELLVELGRFSPLTLSIVRSHHERLDGKGYPDGLKGKEVNFLVRISSIAEIFDSLTSQRPYRAALKSYKALDLMRNELRDGIDQRYFEAFVMMLGRTQ